MQNKFPNNQSIPPKPSMEPVKTERRKRRGAVSEYKKSLSEKQELKKYMAYLKSSAKGMSKNLWQRLPPCKIFQMN